MFTHLLFRIPQAAILAAWMAGAVTVFHTEVSAATDADSGQDRLTPVRSDTVVSFSSGKEHTCILLTNGEVKCIGANDKGQLGTGQGTSTTYPKDAVAAELGSRARFIATGAKHSCALLKDGLVKCWGDNQAGQIGGEESIVYTPTELFGSKETSPETGGAIAIAANDQYTCLLTGDGKIMVWGDWPFTLNQSSKKTDKKTTPKWREVDGLGAGACHICWQWCPQISLAGDGFQSPCACNDKDFDPCETWCDRGVGDPFCNCGTTAKIGSDNPD